MSAADLKRRATDDPSSLVPFAPKKQRNEVALHNQQATDGILEESVSI